MFLEVGIENVELSVVAEDKDFIVSVVPLNSISSVWPFVEAWLDRYPALWNRCQTKESLLENLTTGGLQLWLVSRDSEIYLAFLTEVTHYPTHSSLFVVWAVGKELKRYVRIALSGIESLAASRGISTVYIEGRLGWQKILAPYGYKYVHTTVGKQVAKERAN